MSPVFSEVTGPKFTKYSHDIEASFTLLICIEVVISQSVSECQSDKFRGYVIVLQNWLPWQRPLRNRKKLGRIEKIYAKTFQLVKKIMKIGPLDPEIAFLMLKKKKAKNRPVGKCAERAK